MPEIAYTTLDYDDRLGKHRVTIWAKTPFRVVAFALLDTAGQAQELRERVGYCNADELQVLLAELKFKEVL